MTFSPVRRLAAVLLAAGVAFAAASEPLSAGRHDAADRVHVPASAPPDLTPVPQSTRRESGGLVVAARDSLDGLLPGATVIVEGPESMPPDRGFAVTDGQGEARLAGLPPGRYRIEVSMPGFETGAIDVEIAAGRTARRVVTLALSGFTEQVSVVHDEANAGRTGGFAESLTAEEIDQLPDDEDELSELLRQMAGGDAEFRVNGFEGGELPPKAQIQAIRIRQDPFSPDSQEAGRARVEIITRPGSAAWTHEVNAGFRDQSLDARHAFAPARSEGQTRRASWSVSGPLIRNRTSLSARFFTSSLFEAQTIVATGTGGAFNDVVNRERGRFDAEARVEHALTDTQTLRFEYQRRIFSGDNLGVGDFDLPERAYSDTRERHVLRVSERGTIGRRLFNEFRVEYVDDLQRTESASYDRTINVQNAFVAGGAQRQGGVREQEIEIANELEFVRNDRHTLRIGFEGEFGRSTSDRRDNAAGTFVFASIEDYAAGRPLQYVQRTGDPHVRYSRHEISWWVQDERRLTDRVQLGLGLRHDVQSLLDGKANVAPRASVVWRPFAHDRTSITAGAGVFNSWYSTSIHEQTLRLDGERQRDLIVRNPGFPDPFAGNGEIEQPLPSIVRAAHGLAMPSTRRASVGIEHRATGQIRLRVNVFGQVTGDRLRSLNVNAPVDGVRPDPRYQRITEIRSIGRAESRGVETSARLSARRSAISGMLRYRYAQEWNDADGVLSLPADSNDLGAEWGPSWGDVRHRIFGSFQTPLPYGLRASVTANVRSGTPYTIRTGFDDNGDTVTNDRPEGVGRNTARGTWHRTVDLRLGWRPWPVVRTPAAAEAGRPSVRRSVELYANAFNVLNTTNYTRFTGVMTSPFFGMPTGAAAPRRFDVGARLSF
jgi:outer membrane receptor for ferrienterochelin and colicin